MYNATKETYKKDLDVLKRPTKETNKREVQKRLPKETYESDLHTRLEKETYQRNLQKRSIKETFVDLQKRDLPLKDTDEIYKKRPTG